MCGGVRSHACDSTPAAPTRSRKGAQHHPAYGWEAALPDPGPTNWARPAPGVARSYRGAPPAATSTTASSSPSSRRPLLPRRPRRPRRPVEGSVVEAASLRHRWRGPSPAVSSVASPLGTCPARSSGRRPRLTQLRTPRPGPPGPGGRVAPPRKGPPHRGGMHPQPRRDHVSRSPSARHRRPPSLPGPQRRRATLGPHQTHRALRRAVPAASTVLLGGSHTAPPAGR